MLSDRSIQKYLDTKDIIVTPWHSDMMAPARISLHLGKTILIPDNITIVDIKKKLLPSYKKVILEDEKPFALLPKMFVLGETYEEIGLSEKIGMLLEGRSTLARLGISVVQTAMIIDTGQKPKKITLEIYNASTNTILLYPKMKFCRACFFLLKPPTTHRYDTKGKYTFNDPNMPILEEEFKTS